MKRNPKAKKPSRREEKPFVEEEEIQLEESTSQPAFRFNDIPPTLNDEMPDFGSRTANKDWLGKFVRSLTTAQWLLLLFLAIAAVLAWFMFAGPGAPWLKGVLLHSKQAPTLPVAAANTTRTVSPTPLAGTGRTTTPTSRAKATATPTASDKTAQSASTQPASTQSAPTQAGSGAGETQASPSDTPPPPPSETPAPQPSGDCTPALSVTLDQVGETICVTGIVEEAVQKTDAFYIFFSNDAGTFYFVSYQLNWPDLKRGACVQATGKIQKIIQSPIIVLGYKVPLEDCP